MTIQANILREGYEARELLENPVFVSVMNKLSQDYLGEIINSQPHETKTREDRYLRIQVLRDISDLLQTKVALAEREQMALDSDDPDIQENF
jgi:hypothetical protein